MRVSSPTCGRSILITSAPKSARICPHHGPANTRLKSSTRIPCNAPILSSARSGGCSPAILLFLFDCGWFHADIIAGSCCLPRFRVGALRTQTGLLWVILTLTNQQSWNYPGNEVGGTHHNKGHGK